jgi:DNA-directed RNA polymerase subunit RPC12/RpoP
MNHEYHAYKCGNCRSELILIGRDIDHAAHNHRYIACPYCGSRHLKNAGKFDSLEHCLLGLRD